MPLKLPAVATVRDAFDMQDWSRHKVSHSSSWGGDEENGPSTSSDGGVTNDEASIQQI